jgi:hypothetical protein
MRVVNSSRLQSLDIRSLERQVSFALRREVERRILNVTYGLFIILLIELVIR